MERLDLPSASWSHADCSQWHIFEMVGTCWHTLWQNVIISDDIQLVHLVGQMFCLLIFQRRANARTGMDSRNATDSRGQQGVSSPKLPQCNELDVWTCPQEAIQLIHLNRPF